MTDRTPTDNPFSRPERQGRRGRPEHPEDLRLRGPQRLRDGLRPATGNLWTRRTARRLRGITRSTRMNLSGVDPRSWARLAWWPVQADRNDVPPPRDFRTFSSSGGGRSGSRALPRKRSPASFVLPGSHYSDPEYSWKFVLAPAAIGFLDSRRWDQVARRPFVGFRQRRRARGWLDGVQHSPATAADRRRTRRRQRTLPSTTREPTRRNRRNELRHRHRHPDRPERNLLVVHWTREPGMRFSDAK